MKALRYPILHWQLRPGLVLGAVVGEPIQIARPTLRKVKTALATELRREDCQPEPPIEAPVLRRTAVSLHPAWKKAGRTWPLSTPVQVPVEAVVGRNPAGSFTCHLPRLDIAFVHHDRVHLSSMIEHFVREAFSHMPPDAIFRHLLAPAATLDEVLVSPRVRARPRTVRRPPPERLGAIAEKLPARSAGGQIRAAWGRQAEVERLGQLLRRDRQGSVLVVGPPGVGKSTVLEEAIRQEARGEGASTFWRTAARRLTSGARYLGDWQGLCDQLVGEMLDVNGVLWVDGIDELTRMGGSGPEDSVAAFLEPALAEGRLRLVGELTPRQLDALRGRLPSFLRHFAELSIEPMTVAETMEVVELYAQQLERNHKLLLGDKARRLAVSLLARHVRGETSPGREVRFLADLAHHASVDDYREIDVDYVLHRFTTRTGLPAPLLDDTCSLDPVQLKEWFQARIIGQAEAVDAVCRAVEIFKTGLDDPDRPVATLLFAGPTGVGKTALARALARYLFGGRDEEEALVRVDMSELQVPGQAARLIGGADGSPGELIRRIRARPFCVVLFDEVEKADPTFFDMLLTLLDEGRLSDGTGRLTDFRSTVVILTSNLGAGSTASVGFGGSSGAADLGAVRAFFRPEFFNRLDEVIAFHPLQKQHIDAIARLELGGLAAREGLRSRKLELVFSDALVAFVARTGVHPEHGARALQRVIEEQVVGPLSEMLLEMPDLRNACLQVDHDGDSVRVTRA